ncbi:hypothetical protein ACWOA0_08485 [Ignavigranum ruoffiae]|uniref:Competence protein ComGD n=1 Tax=Ignavigranum ruoffiae TaxID=89093 RepID=A0A1H9AQQ7_9LACT|nr:hypothetical protein [Ignavigranum ruoffiae]SEP78875.1 hypothetical protein SAMN04488558_10248 [Ignavigranum ruoffiae]
MRLKSAFTFAEISAVLFVISVILILVQPPNIQAYQFKLESRAYLQELVQTINYYKEKSVLENTNYLIDFDAEAEVITVMNQDEQEILLKHTLPDTWDLKNNLRLSYLADGRISDFRAVNFYQSQTDQAFALRFQLGSGIFTIEEVQL